METSFYPVFPRCIAYGTANNLWSYQPMPWKPCIPPTPAKPVEGDITPDPYDGD